MNENPHSPPPEGNVAKRLAAAGRIDFRMLTEEQSITAEQRAQLLGELEDWRRDHPKNDGRPHPLNRLAGLIGVSPSVLTEVLHGKYKGDTDNVMRLLDTFLAEERQKVGRHDFRQFARIGLTQKIFGAINVGLQLNSMPVIIGEPGSCKTAHARAFAITRGSCVLLRIEDEPADRRTVTELLCDAIQELRPMKDKPHRRRLESIKSWLAKRRQTVLIIDEAQKLSASGLEVLRDLHDGSDPEGKRCMPVVFFGDKRFKDLIAATRDGRTTKVAAQMVRRMSPIFEIQSDGCVEGGDGDLYTVEDIVAVTRNSRIKLLTRAALRWLTLLANVKGYGYLGFAIMVLRQGTILYSAEIAANKQLDVEEMQESFMATAGRRLAIEIDQAAGGELLSKTA